MPKYDEKPADSDKTFAEIYKAVLPEDVKLIIVGDVMTQADAEDALQYTDLVATGRATLIDPDFAQKICAGRGDAIVHKISPAQVEKAKLTPGLVNLFSDPKMEPHLPGRESIYDLHQEGSLDKSVLKNGTSSEYNLAAFK